MGGTHCSMMMAQKTSMGWAVVAVVQLVVNLKAALVWCRRWPFKSVAKHKKYSGYVKGGSATKKVICTFQG